MKIAHVLTRPARPPVYRGEGVVFRPVLAGLPALALGAILGVSAAAAEPPTAAQVAKQYETLRGRTYYRHASAIFDTVGRFNQIDESQLEERERFVRAYYEGRWGEVRKTLAGIAPDVAAGIYDKILGDLAGRNVPILTLDDCLGLTDACPGELTSERIRKLGLLLRIAVPKDQKLWLEQALQKGTAKLGDGAQRRLVTGRILFHADFADLARRYLPPLGEATQLEDEAARDEIVKFLASQDELDEFEQTKVSQLWTKHVKVLTDASADTGKSQAAADGLADLLGRAPMTMVEPGLRRLVRENPDSALRLAASFGRLSQTKLNDQNIEVRTNNLRAQNCLLKCVSETAGLQGTWNPLALAMADWWIREAENTFKDGLETATGTAKSRLPHVAPAELLETLPNGAWAEALPASIRERLDLCVSKAVLVSDRYEEAVGLIAGLAKRNSNAGIALAEEYLKVWASRHNPHVPESVRKQHNLPGDARIMVTPIMMERNIESLAKMMDVFRAHGIPPANGQLVVDAFDICYSQAEVYRVSDLERVFGKVEEMDEGLFQHVIQKMTQGLATRWRNVKLQEESGTRRDERQTLEMVRQGYQAAVAMLDRRVKKYPQAWRFLVTAGSLLSDWGDFEYFQQLVADTATQRLAAFKEKNSAAHTYFQKAAAAYGQQVPQLNRANYAMEPYLAWFHSLLGVGSQGSLNLSKPLDRAALDEIREALRALPPAAAQAHLDRFAKQINTRLADTAQPLHEDLKYKYLASSLVITKDSPFSFQAQEKVTYYDELLHELRLETRVDGPNVIHRDHEFGIFLTVQHTEAMGRMADFGKYLTNELPPGGNPAAGGGKKPARTTSPLLTAKRMINVQGRRDELERNITEALSLFYDIRSVTFSPRDVRPRATEKPGWQETVLVYVHVKAKDASVDKIPRIQLNLEFLDLTGPVTIMAESAETLLKLTDQPVPPRPFQRLEITSTLDARNLSSSGELLLEVAANACGLLPPLDELLDLSQVRQAFPITRVDEHEGNVVRQLESWGDTVHAVSERRWTLALDGSAVEKEGRPVEFQLPPAKSAEATVHYQTYRDMDLVELDKPTTRIGSAAASEEPAVPMPAADVRRVAVAGAAGLVLLWAMVYGLIRRARRRRTRPLRARDVFRLPEEIDGFSVVRLLRALTTSELARLSSPQRAELQAEIERLQAACFRGHGATLSEPELRGVAQKWLRLAC